MQRDETSGEPAPTDELLSARKAEVLVQIAQSASNKHIARPLVLCPHTFKRHLATILGKLGLNSCGEPAAWWSRRKPHARSRIGG